MMSIRDLRKRHDLTQQELAFKVRVAVSSISNWESGRNEPSARQLRALALTFGVPMEDIAFESDRRAKNIKLTEVADSGTVAPESLIRRRASAA